MAEPTTLEGLRRRACDELARAAQDSKHPFHWPAFATVDSAGRPVLRTVVLRAFDETGPAARFFTDARSPKLSHLAQHPAVSWLFYDAEQRLQVRLDGMGVVIVDEGGRRQGFERARKGLFDYAGQLPPGTVIPDARASDHPDATESEAFPNFCIVETRVTQLEVLQLRREGHLRALYAFHPPEAHWLAP
ncbi:MAG TPA: pyridoxamine 5'-phosphate oxidase family protein [Chthoniobacterales bacterium]